MSDIQKQVEQFNPENPEFGYKTRKETAVSWDELPTNNQTLMITVANIVSRKIIRSVVEDLLLFRRHFDWLPKGKQCSGS